jgi:hypothetical protein
MWPLIERELRIALRQNAPRRRWHFALGGGGICALLLIGANATFGGRDLFGLLLLFGIYVAVVPVLRSAADCFSLERRSGTLELLFLAGLSPLEIFISKLSGVFISSCYNLLGLVPFLSLPFLSGGISGECFFATSVMLLNLLLFALSVSVFASVLCNNEGAAFMLAILLGSLICLLMPAVWYVLNYLSSGSISDAILLLSPAYAEELVAKGLPPGTVTEFWKTSAITFAYSMALLTAAATILRFTWQDQSTAFIQVRFNRWFMRRLDLGETARLRSVWLERNPFAWLVLRDRLTVRTTAGLLIACAIIWAVLALAWPHRFATPVNAMVTAIVANGILITSVGIAAARRFSEDRRNGAFELLLTTPLNEVEIMGGYQAALRDLFRPLYSALFIGDGVLAVVPLLTHTWANWAAFISYSLIWLLILVFCVRSQFSIVPQTMWVSLNSGRTIYSVWRSFNLGWWGIWIGYNIFTSGSRLGRFPTGSVFELLFVFVAAIIVFVIMTEKIGSEHAKYQWLLTQYFRGLSTSPLPPASDPRWKKWDMKEPFPGYGFMPPEMNRVV